MTPTLFTLAATALMTQRDALAELGVASAWNSLAIRSLLALAFCWVIRRISQAPAFAALRRWLPLVFVITWFLVVVFWLQRHFVEDGLSAFSFAFAVALVGAAALPWLHDIFWAVVFGVEHRYRIGDDLRVSGKEGRLVAVHARNVVLRANDGTEVAIPHSKFAREDVIRLNVHTRDAPCELEFQVPTSMDLDRATSMAVRAAALSPYAAPCVEPRALVVADCLTSRLRIKLQGSVFDREHDPLYRSDVTRRFFELIRESANERATVATPTSN